MNYKQFVEDNPNYAGYVLAIESNSLKYNNIFLVKLSIERGKVYHYLNPPTWMTVNNDDLILHIFGKSKELDMDYVDIEFSKLYYKPKTYNTDRLLNFNFYGFLSPNGDFYKCEFGEHTSTARSIVKCIYEEYVYNSEDFLYEKGWITFNSVFATGNKEKITDKQKEKLEEIFQQFERKISGIKTYIEISKENLL